jgi:hypothetical protein
MSAPPPPPPHPLGSAEAPPAPLISPLAFDQLLAQDPERAAALLRLLDGPSYIAQAEAHAALVSAPIARILIELGELLELSGEPKKAPPRPRKPRRQPSITPNPNVPRRPSPTPHGPSDGRRRRWPRYIRMRVVRASLWA